MQRISLRPATRREYLASATALGAAVAFRTASAQDDAARPSNNCPRCGGSGRVPLKEAQPFVWVEGASEPRAAAAIGEQACPVCQTEPQTEQIAAEKQQQIDGALANHRQWEERTGWQLTCVLTRHAAIHTQVTAAQAKSVGTAIEQLMLHLQRITSSLALTPTRPDQYEQILLWERPAWDKFREVMETLYTPQQLGESWRSARQMNSYDHYVTQHLYETAETIRQRPLTCGPVFLAARRQIERATGRHASLWLTEGFAAYGDRAVHKVNRWYTLYSQDQTPPTGDWLAEARKLAARAQLRSWPQILQRELRDWQPADYAQTLGMTAFLLESEPAKFVDFVRRLATGEPDTSALEDAYQQPMDRLEQLCSRWLLTRR